MLIFQHKNKYKQQGLAAIELTLILPMLLFLVFVVAEFSRLLYQYNALNKTLRDASRYMINYANPGDGSDVEITALIANRTNAILVGGGFNATSGILPNFAINTSSYSQTGNNITITDVDYTLNISVSGEYVTLVVVYDWQPIFSDLLPTFVTSNSYNLDFPLTARYTMRIL